MGTSNTTLVTETTTDDENPFTFSFADGRIFLEEDGDEVFCSDAHPLSKVLDHLEHAIKRARVAFVKHKQFEEGIKLMEQEFERSEAAHVAAAGTGLGGLALNLLGSGRRSETP